MSDFQEIGLRRHHEHSDYANGQSFYDMQKNDERSDVVLEETLEINVSPSDTVADWLIRCNEEPEMRSGKPVIRLGQVFGPFTLSCFDEYGNIQNANAIERDLKVEVWSEERKLDIQLSTLGLQHDATRSSLIMEGILFTGGLLQDISPDYVAYLKFCIHNMVPMTIGIIVLPGDLHSVQELRIQQVDNCLQKGDIIQTFELKVIDCWGNHVEKGCRVLLELEGIQLQDNGITDRMVDDEGCIRLGGLLKVTGNFNSKAEIHVRSHQGKLLYERKFHLLRRHLVIVSEVPKNYTAGGLLENVLVAIVDEEKNVVTHMTGSHHLIAVKSCADTAYCLEAGCCCISMIQLPEVTGLWCCEIYDKLNPELEAQFEINLLPHEPRLDVVSVADDDYFTPSASYNLIPASPVNNEKKVGRMLRKIERHKQELKELNFRKEQNLLHIAELKGEITVLQTEDRGLEINEELDDLHEDGSDFLSVGKEISRRSSASRLLLKSVYEGTIPKSSVIGIVALLAYTEDKLLSKTLADYIGEVNMLAVVCETSEAVSCLVRHSEINGEIDETWGLFKRMKDKMSEGDKKLRAYVTSEMGPCMYERHAEDPQKRLKMVEPKLHGAVPEGFVDFAVNMLLLDQRHLELRSSLFYKLFGEAQVYKTMGHLVRARSVLMTGGISLDGGIIHRERGYEDFGKWESSEISFPVNPYPSGKVESLSIAIRKVEVQDVLEKKRRELESSALSLKELEGRIEYLKRNLRVSSNKCQILMEGYQTQCSQP